MILVTHVGRIRCKTVFGDAANGYEKYQRKIPLVRGRGGLVDSTVLNLGMETTESPGTLQETSTAKEADKKLQMCLCAWKKNIYKGPKNKPRGGANGMRIGIIALSCQLSPVSLFRAFRFPNVAHFGDLLVFQVTKWSPCNSVILRPAPSSGQI